MTGSSGGSSRLTGSIAPAGATRKSYVEAVRSSGSSRKLDEIAVEEPLEIRVVTEDAGRRRTHSIAVTMRTPGHDFELAAGFLLSEGAVKEPRTLWRISYCEGGSPEEQGNIVEVHLVPGAEFDSERLSRLVYTSSSCGICGKASIEAVHVECEPIAESDFVVASDSLVDLPSKLQGEQAVFARTGGLHAAGMFDAEGDLQRLREDVGRHNAVDKLVGSLLLGDSLPASRSILLVSGRASFELVQKAVCAGFPIMAAVGAPSSLAIDLAREQGLTLAGFVRQDGFNIYSGGSRIRRD